MKSRCLQRLYRALGESELSLREYVVLAIVQEQVEVFGLRRLALLMGMPLPSMSILLRGLELRGLVRMNRTLADRRRKVLELTDGGLELCRKIELSLA